jgi:hypothetical protein
MTKESGGCGCGHDHGSEEKEEKHTDISSEKTETEEKRMGAPGTDKERRDDEAVKRAVKE